MFTVAQNGEKLQDSQCIFELTPTQADQIRNARSLTDFLLGLHDV